MCEHVFASYPIDFDALWSHAIAVDLPGACPRIASIDHLIQMKRQAARPQDQIDIEKLTRLKQYLDEASEPRDEG